MAPAVRAFLQSEEAPLKDFFDTWKFKILVGIAVFLAAIMAYAGANGRLTAAPQEILSVAVAPFQRAAAACAFLLARYSRAFMRSYSRCLSRFRARYSLEYCRW